MFIPYFTEDIDRLEIMLDQIWMLAPYPYKEYASWMFFHIVRSHKMDCQPYYEKLVDVLFLTNDQSVLRNVVNCFQELKITEYRESEFVDLLISFIQNSTNKVALQVYSIYVLIQFCKKYPDLTEEIRAIIALHSEGKSIAYRVAERNFRETFKIN